MPGSDPHEATGVREGDLLAGKYRIERVLGVGGMGAVVAARHLQLDTKVAIKFLLPHTLTNRDAVGRFAREARAAVKITSEHVARVIDVGTLESGAPYMVMEHLDGGDLAGWLKQRGPLPIDQAVEFLLQACVAVADAHGLGIVHRDLKPANLFCLRRSDGQFLIKVLDFGISKMTETTSPDGALALTKTSSVMGSPLYMSPEQMQTPKEVDAQTDIWALGVTLYELLTARVPFDGETVAEVAVRAATEAPPAIRTFRPDVPLGLETIIFKCLAKDRRGRYRHVGELATALLEFAPKRARNSVERISGIIQASGLSLSALALPPSIQDDAQKPGGTLPPVGRTTSGSSKPRTTVLSAVIAIAVALVAVAGAMLVKRSARPAVEQPSGADHSAVAAVTSRAPAIVGPRSDEPPATATTTAASPPAERATSPVDAPVKRRASPTRSVQSASQPAASAVVPVPPPLATLPAPVKTCNPPYYFDSRGNRVFKPECPL